MPSSSARIATPPEASEVRLRVPAALQQITFCLANFSPDNFRPIAGTFFREMNWELSGTFGNPARYPRIERSGACGTLRQVPQIVDFPTGFAIVRRATGIRSFILAHAEPEPHADG
jgi:hypothetical protein